MNALVEKNNYIELCIVQAMVLIATCRGRARGPAGFDAPFNIGSAKCKIEWNSIFQGKYLTDYIK